MDEKVLDRAVDAALEGLDEAARRERIVLVQNAVEDAAPVIVAAAVKEAKARVEAVRADAPAWPDDDSYEAGLDAALAAIDKEGEGKKRRSANNPDTQRVDAEPELIGSVNDRGLLSWLGWRGRFRARRRWRWGLRRGRSVWRPRRPRYGLIRSS